MAVQRGAQVTAVDASGEALALARENAAVTGLEDRVQLPRVYDTWHTVKGFAPDDAGLEVLGDILAEGKASRLYKRLVYELQIATQVAAFQDAGRIDGKFEIFATARPGRIVLPP